MTDKRIQIIVEIALAIALAAVLNMLKIWRMPNAGTVSFVMLPLIVIALRRGLLVGLATGALYGVVDFVIDPFPPVHWLQPLLDYPLAYGSVGLAGLVSPLWRTAVGRGSKTAAFAWIALACTIAACVRYGAHVASGVLFFAEYAPENQSPLLYSALYNLYVPASGVLAAAAATVVLPTLQRAVPVETTRALT